MFGHTYLIEFFQIGSIDGYKTDAFIQRQQFISGLQQHPVVEGQPTHITVEITERGRCLYLFFHGVSFFFPSKVVHLHHKAKKKMKRIGLLSDTHAFWDEKYLKYFESCDEIWHAGDIGSLEVAERLAAFRPLRAVYGNIDGQEIRRLYPQTLRFTVEEAEVVMKHIGGYPGKYDPSIVGSLMVRPPKLFISGHSHILKVKYDKTLDMLHINPGAAGNYGFHKVRTLVRFTVNGAKFEDMEVVELSD